MSGELWIKGGELWILVGFFDALKCGYTPWARCARPTPRFARSLEIEKFLGSRKTFRKGRVEEKNNVII